jgi:hypothetical protein
MRTDEGHRVEQNSCPFWNFYLLSLILFGIFNKRFRVQTVECSKARRSPTVKPLALIADNSLTLDFSFVHLINQTKNLMKSLKAIFILTTFTFIFSCGQKDCDKGEIVYSGVQVSSPNTAPSSYEIDVTGHDTINWTDNNGLRQGRWIVRDLVIPGGKRPNETKEEMASRAQRVKFEEGRYKDGKKQGVWKYYNQDGTTKETIEYKDDIPV